MKNANFAPLILVVLWNIWSHRGWTSIEALEYKLMCLFTGNPPCSVWCLNQFSSTGCPLPPFSLMSSTGTPHVPSTTGKIEASHTWNQHLGLAILGECSLRSHLQNSSRYSTIHSMANHFLGCFSSDHQFLWSETQN